ncbi:MAG TPA: OmpH family outer membrane protein [Pirellulaceae bacterium]|nr:OmpH family outer membrane protein [Pirellulaceae bacterium]
MKSLSFSFVLVCVTCAAVSAQDAARGGIVAVLDVARVFQSNAEFDRKMQDIRQQADRLRSEAQREQEQIRQEAMQLQGVDPNSAQFKQLEATLEQRHTNLRTQAGQSERDLLVKEATIYFETYQKMQSVVSRIAQREGIALVLRFDSSPIDPENRGDVIKGVNRNVVFYDRLDMTDLVIDEMGPRVAEQKPAGTTPR